VLAAEHFFFSTRRDAGGKQHPCCSYASFVPLADAGRLMSVSSRPKFIVDARNCSKNLNEEGEGALNDIRAM
jgi:hypothetical protein